MPCAGRAREVRGRSEDARGAPRLREALLDEVEYMYTADINDGKKDAEVKSHLKDNLQTARQMYAQRYASEGPSAAPLLEEHLVSVIEARKTTPFGRDLTAIVGRAARGQEKGSRAAGQAS
jgi:hypothetical protein